MGTLLKHKFRLRPSILTLFLVLTVPVFFAIVAVNYLSNDAVARANALELVERFRRDAIGNIQDDFNPIKSLVRSAATLGSEQPDFFADDKSLKYFMSILEHSEKIVSVYVALEDGTFRQTRRVDPLVPVQGKLPPAGTRFAYRWVLPSKNGAIDRFVFLDTDGKELGRSEQASTYDPRPRGWYRNTVAAGTTSITEPDIFSALGLIGITVAAPFRVGGKVHGVAAIDITLEDFSQYLSDRKISRGTVSYMLDHQGRVIANSDLSKTYTNVNGLLELQHVTSVESELPGVAFSKYPRGSEKPYFFVQDGREYLASLTTLPHEFGKRWQLFVIAPLDDFTRAFQVHNERMLAFGLGAVLLQVLIIYFLTGVVSAPLEKLSLKVNRIQDLGAEGLPSRPSPIREISVLSRAIDTLDIAIKSFAAFVPLGLVRQLLDSDQKFELGGHSRFLTIFFSDLEDFSTLSEQIPSQELLTRVSAYIEVVTKAVNSEHGTIDKFLGDGVMAFWGAPALLEDHAWRSCVAALRVEHDMAELNARWEAQGLKRLRVRMGIHSDAVLVGNIGSRERMSYTVVGDGVNVAARLEGINKEFRTSICVSHSVFKEAGERLCVRPIDDVLVKGRRGKITIYELLGVYGAGPELEPSPQQIRLAALGRIAYEALVHDDRPGALDAYRQILAEFPGDTVATELMRRLAAGSTPLPALGLASA